MKSHMEHRLRFTRLLFVLGLLLAETSAGAETMSLTYEDLPDLVRSKNHNVTGAKLITESSQQKTGHLARSFLPAVKAHAGVESFQTGTSGIMTQPYGSIEAKINLYQGGRDALEDEIRRQQTILSNSVERRTYESELREARKTFWNLVFVREMIAILKEANEQNEKNLAAANRRISRGLAARTDRLEFEINRSQTREEIESLEHEDLMIEIKLASFVGLPLETQFATPETIPHEHHDSEATAKLSSETHPEVQSIKANSDIADTQRKINHRWWLPSLDLYSEYSILTKRESENLTFQDRREAAVGIRLTLNLFDGLQSRNAGSALDTHAKGLEQQALQRARAVQAEFRVAQEEMKHDHELIHESEKRIEQGRTYLASTLEEYDRGVKNSPDVLNATDKLVAFRRRNTELRRNYHLARADLLAVSEGK